VATAPSLALQLHGLPRQGAGDEHGLTVDAGDATAIVIQRDDIGSLRLGFRFQTPAHAAAKRRQ
jgi:hypothetical protein